MLQLLIVLSCVGSLPTHAQSNHHWSLKWDDGKLVSLRSRNAYEWVDQHTTPTIPVRLQLFGHKPPQWNTQTLTFLHSHNVSTTTTVNYYQYKSLVVSLQTTLTLAGECRWNFTLQRGADTTPVAAISAPVFKMPRTLTPQHLADTYMVAGLLDGIRATNPAQRVPGARPILKHTYPGPMSTQMMTYYGNNTGLLWYTADTAGHQKRFVFQQYPSPSGPLGQIDHNLHCLQSEICVQPYETVLQEFVGDWYTAADIYKKWFCERTDYCNVQLRNRKDLSPIVAMPYPLMQDGVTSSPNSWWGQHSYAPATFYERVSNWSKQVDNRKVAVTFFGWEQHGTWCAVDYFPPTGGDNFKKGATLARENGHAIFAFISGTRFSIKTLKNFKGPQGDYTALWEKVKHSIGAYYWNGQPVIQNVSWGLENAWLNIASQATKDLMLGYYANASVYNISMVQLDQNLAMEMFPSWNYSGNSVGYSNLYSQHGQQFLRDARTHGRSQDPYFTTTMERPSELTIQILDMPHTRLYELNTVPLFSYMFHQYQAGYSGWTDPQKHVTSSYLNALARGAVNGQHIGIRVFRFHNEYAPQWITQYRALVHFQQNQGNPYLVFGRMLPMPWRINTNSTGWLEMGSYVDEGSYRCGTILIGLAATRVTFSITRWKDCKLSATPVCTVLRPNSTHAMESVCTVVVGPDSVAVVDIPDSEFAWVQW